MKHRLFSRSIALLLVFSLLLTGFMLPVSATTVSTVSNLSSSLSINEGVVKEDNLIISDEIILRADDPRISEESMILSYVDSVQFNAARHTQRLPELEDLNTYVFANADGTRSIYMMHENVKYVDEDGAVREKDISLKSKIGGFGIVQSNVELFIPSTPLQGIDLEYSGFAIKLIPQGVTNAASAIQNDNSVVYDKAYGQSTKLVYTPLLSGVKEDIILSQYTANATYTFVLETDGLSIYGDESSYYLANSSKADPIFYLGEILIYDAVGKPAVGTMTVETVTEGQEYLLTVTADDDFLSDPTTVYPVTIDPSITVSDSTTTGSIIDAPIFEGYPSRNYATYVYNRVGTPSASYGIGRTVVKLSGLTSSNEYQTIAANQITNVTFYAKEASGGSTQYINLYPLTSNTTWTESTVTWGNIGSHDTSVNYGNTMYNNQWTAFNITNLVKAWKNGTYSADAGFIMTNENEANNKCFCSSEFSTASYRPYVVMTYDTAISLNYSSTSIVEGGTRTLVATTKPSGLAVSWSSNNNAIATVSSTGVVTAKKAGTVTITASMTDTDGFTRYAYCTIYVYVANGVYHIKNLNSNYYLHVKYGGIDNFTDVYQYSKYADTATPSYRIRQMWKTFYLGNGRYSVRPMNKLDMGLDVTGGNVDIYNIGTSDTLSSIQSYGEWTIEWNSNGYVFKNNGSSSLTMQVDGASTSVSETIVASTYSTGANCLWDIINASSPPSGVYWYDTSSESVLSGTSTSTKTINCGATSDAEDLGLVPVLYSPSSNNQTFTWSSGDTSIATVNSTSGLISAKNAGDVVVTATSSYGKYTLQLNVRAKSTDPFHYHNIQYMRYVRITGTNWWGLGSDTDHTINIVKSTMLADDYCVIHDNINTGYYREIYINQELKNTLNNLEAGYQDHYSFIPLFDTTTTQERAAHSSKGETDQLVDDGYFASGSSEYYGVWAYNYISTLNLLEYWRGVIDTATAAYSVYLTATTFYYSYLVSTSTASMQVTSSQYSNTASILDDIDDAMSGMSYNGKTTLSAEARNTTLANQGYTNPLPYKPQTPVVKYQQTSSTQYVRVFNSNNKTGKWLMKYSDIQGLTPAQIQSKFALPSTPTHYCFVNVPSGTTVYVGVVNQSSVSGTLQFELGTTIPNSSFGTSIPLP